MFNRKKLASYLQDNEITHSAFAERVFVTREFVSYLLAGAKQPSVALLKRIANEMQCSMDELVTED